MSFASASDESDDKAFVYVWVVVVVPLQRIERSWNIIFTVAPVGQN
jgi:hypothetical protein